MKTALITGASSGFGLGVTLELARRGWRVFAGMRDLAKSDNLVAQAQAAGVATHIEIVELDVTIANSVERAVTRTLEQSGGSIEALVNNAGYSVLGAFEDLTEEDCRRQMETNFFGVLAMTRAILPSMRKAQGGRIVVVTSNAVNSPHPLLSIYAASKWALEGWAEGLAMEIAPFGIDITVLQPGAHRTEFAGNVQFVAPDDSAYAQWLEDAMPGVMRLDGWGRDPALCIGPIADAVTSASVPFRQQVGEDSQVFAALKGSVPFETRALLLRAICGLPQPGSYAGSLPNDSAAIYPVLTDVLSHAMARAGKDPALAATLALTFGFEPIAAV